MNDLDQEIRTWVEQLSEELKQAGLRPLIETLEPQETALLMELLQAVWESAPNLQQWDDLPYTKLDIRSAPGIVKVMDHAFDSKYDGSEVARMIQDMSAQARNVVSFDAGSFRKDFQAQSGKKYNLKETEELCSVVWPVVGVKLVGKKYLIELSSCLCQGRGTESTLLCTSFTIGNAIDVNSWPPISELLAKKSELGSSMEIDEATEDRVNITAIVDGTQYHISVEEVKPQATEYNRAKVTITFDLNTYAIYFRMNEDGTYQINHTQWGIPCSKERCTSFRQALYMMVRTMRSLGGVHSLGSELLTKLVRLLKDGNQVAEWVESQLKDRLYFHKASVTNIDEAFSDRIFNTSATVTVPRSIYFQLEEVTEDEVTGLCTQFFVTVMRQPDEMGGSFNIMLGVDDGKLMWRSSYAYSKTVPFENLGKVLTDVRRSDQEYWGEVIRGLIRQQDKMGEVEAWFNAFLYSRVFPRKEGMTAIDEAREKIKSSLAVQIPMRITAEMAYQKSHMDWGFEIRFEIIDSAGNNRLSVIADIDRDAEGVMRTSKFDVPALFEIKSIDDLVEIIRLNNTNDAALRRDVAQSLKSDGAMMQKLRDELEPAWRLFVPPSKDRMIDIDESLKEVLSTHEMKIMLNEDVTIHQDKFEMDITMPFTMSVETLWFGSYDWFQVRLILVDGTGNEILQSSIPLEVNEKGEWWTIQGWCHPIQQVKCADDFLSAWKRSNTGKSNLRWAELASSAILSNSIYLDQFRDALKEIQGKFLTPSKDKLIKDIDESVIPHVVGKTKFTISQLTRSAKKAGEQLYGVDGLTWGGDPEVVLSSYSEKLKAEVEAIGENALDSFTFTPDTYEYVFFPSTGKGLDAADHFELVGDLDLLKDVDGMVYLCDNTENTVIKVLLPDIVDDVQYKKTVNLFLEEFS